MCRTGYLRQECTPREHWRCPPVPLPHDIQYLCQVWSSFFQRNCRNKSLAGTSCPIWVWIIHPGLNEKVPRTGALCKGTAGSFCSGLPLTLAIEKWVKRALAMEETQQWKQETSEIHGKWGITRAPWWQKPSGSSELHQQKTRPFFQHFYFKPDHPFLLPE